MKKTRICQYLLCLWALLMGAQATFAASELPLLTTDASDPILYRIKNTRRTSKGTANYWTPTSLTTSQDAATQVYFTGSKTGSTLCVKIHLKDSGNTLTADFGWGDGVDWYIKPFASAQGGTDVTTGSTYKGVIISNASTFPNVTGDKPADDGLGCWYVGSSNTAAWLYGGQWDGSIFTMEIVDPSRLPDDPSSTGLVVNPSFEEGDLTGWVYGAIGGDHFVKPTSDEIFATAGTDGEYLFNTWYSGDSYVADTQNQCVYQTIKNVPAGEYALSVLVSSNAKQNVTLFANDFTLDFVPAHKSTFDEQTLEGIFVTDDIRSLTLGLRSVSWFRADGFKLVSLGQTDAYKAYVESKYANASIAQPVMIDAFDGQDTKSFTYKEIGAHTHGGYPIATGGIMGDRTMTDRSKMQNWTGNSYKLGNSDTYVSYTNLPNGYYRISSEVRVYDLNGDYNGSVSGLSIYGNDDESAITSGTAITHGTNSGKGFFGEYNVICQVTDGSLEAGLRLRNADFNWLGWQNFRIEYIGTTDPGTEYLNLNLPSGEFAALCLPFDLKPAFFGQTYTVAQVADNRAVLIPVDEVPAGTPCVVKATGENHVSVSDLKFNFNAPALVLTLWDNALLQGSFDNHSWIATDVKKKTLQPADLSFEVADLANMNFTATIENNAANRFWVQNASYSTSSATVIEKYLNEPTYVRRDQPNPVLIPVSKKAAAQTLTYSRNADFSNAKTVTVAANQMQAEIYNLMPGFTYYYKSADGKSAGQFTVGGTLRMIYVGNHVYNMRDLGGKKTSDGRYVKYGRIFRSGEMNGGYVANTDELQIMRDMGVGAEIDLRNEESGTGVSPFGFTEAEGTYYAVRGKNYIADGPNSIDKADAHLHWKNEFLCILNNLRQHRGIDFHCRIGADRTGMLAILLEGLMGVKEADLLRDYETTSFSTAAGTRLKNVNGFDNLLNTTFKNNIPAGGTLRDAFDKFFINTLGIAKSDIVEFRSLMLADDPTADADEIEMLSAIEVLKAAIRDAHKYAIGEGASQYTCSNAGKLDAYNKALADAEAYIQGFNYDQTTINTHVQAVNSAAKALVPYLTLNMPKAGTYFYLKSATYDSYISCSSEADAQGYTRFPMKSQTDKYCIFLYDGTRFVNYMTELCFSADPIEYGNGIGDRSNMIASKADGAAAIKVVASKNKTIGAYNLYTPKAVLLLKAAGNNLDGFSDWLQHTDADCLFEEVGELPSRDEDGVNVVIPSLQVTSDDVYDLSGRRVLTPSRGLYIKGGKKLVR